MADFAGVLDSLWALQALDSTVAKSKREIADAEKALETAQSRVIVAEGVLKTAQDATAELRRQHKEVENELAKLDTRIKQLEQQGGVAGMRAADKQREHVDEFEMKGLELLEKIPDLEAAESKAQEKLTRQETLAAESNERAKAVSIERTTSIDDALKQRKEMLPAISEIALEVYEMSQAKHAGSALCYTVDEICDGCSGSLTRSHISQLKARAEIIRCPHCRRIHDSR
ncbi:hypothetical protein OAU50_07635 [Planctomycetota bacterium]|nr:hypothetical protein [Planctomycetota bacterium]